MRSSPPRVTSSRVSPGGGQPLEARHVVGDDDLAGAGVVGDEVVPRRPRPRRPRQERLVGVEPGGVAAVGECPEDTLLLRRRTGEHRQGRRGMDRDDDTVECLAATAGGHVDPRPVVLDRGHRRGEADVRDPAGDGLDVGAAAPEHGPPRRRPDDPEHPVVVEEGEQVPGRVPVGVLGVAGPHGRDERRHEPAAEVGGEAGVVEEVPERRADVVRIRLRLREEGPRQPVEARDLAEHPQVAGAAQDPGRREQPGQAASAGVLDAVGVGAHGHAHVGLERLDPELGEEAQEGRVGPVVVDDEAGVDREHAAVDLHVVGVGVAAEPRVRLVEGDLAGPGQDVGGDEPGHTGADDGVAGAAHRTAS